MRRIVEKYIRYGDRQAENAKSYANQIKELEEELRTMDKSDLRENFDYTDTVSRLQALYTRNASFKYWERYYRSFRKFLMDENRDNSMVTVGAVVSVKTSKRKMTILLVPEHLGNRGIFAIGVDSPLGQGIIGKKKGDIVVVLNMKYEIEEVY